VIARIETEDYGFFLTKGALKILQFGAYTCLDLAPLPPSMCPFLIIPSSLTHRSPSEP